jgi:hypothetical protein
VSDFGSVLRVGIEKVSFESEETGRPRRYPSMSSARDPSIHRSQAGMRRLLGVFLLFLLIPAAGSADSSWVTLDDLIAAMFETQSYSDEQLAVVASGQSKGSDSARLETDVPDPNRLRLSKGTRP